MVDRLAGEQKGEQADLARKTLDNTLDNYKQRLDVAVAKFTVSQEEYVENIKTETQNATTEFKGFMETLVNEETTKSVAAANERAVTEATAVATTISQIKDKFIEARGILDEMIRRTQEEHEKGNKEDEMKGDNMSKRSTLDIATDAFLGNNFNLNTWKSRGELAKRAWNKVTSWFNDGISFASGVPMTVAASSVTPIHDGTASMGKSYDSSVKPSGMPLAVPASSVTPIHDGTTIAKTDPQDHAIFAKVGGPFDTLFNGVFGRINEIYESLLTPTNATVSPQSSRKKSLGESIREYQKLHILNIMNESSESMFEQPSDKPQITTPLPSLQSMPMQIESGNYNSSNVAMTNGSTHVDFSNINVDLSGEVRLTVPNGQSIDILKELQNNPVFLRDITKYISDGISRQVNGGRGISNGGRMVSF